jgi:hypothetical protein
VRSTFQRLGKLGKRRKEDRMPRCERSLCQRQAQVCFAGAGRAEKDHIGTGSRHPERSPSSRSLRSESVGWKEKSNPSSVFFPGIRAALSRLAIAFCSRPSSSAASARSSIVSYVHCSRRAVSKSCGSPASKCVKFSCLYAPFAHPDHLLHARDSTILVILLQGAAFAP